MFLPHVLLLTDIEIIKSKSLNIVCRHGGFHTMMKGSGLQEALETIYGPNAVNHNYDVWKSYF